MLKAACLRTVLFLCLSALLRAQAGDYEVVHYSTGEGLSDTYVTCMVQDSSGFLWIGTRNWLNRFDGYEFVVYNDLPGSRPRLHGTSIQQLISLPGHKIFIKYHQSDAFADVLDTRTDTITTMWLDQRSGFKGRYIRYFDVQGNPYFLSKDREFTYVHQLDKNLTFRRLFAVPHHPCQAGEANWTNSLVPVDDAQTTWLVQTLEHGLRQVNSRGEVLQVFSEKDIAVPLEAENLSGTTLERQAGGRIVIRFLLGTDREILVEYLPDSERWLAAAPRTSSEMPGNEQTWFYEKHSSDVFYVGRQSGFQKVTPARRHFQTFCAGDLQAGELGISARGMAAIGHDRVFCSTENAGWFLLDAKTGGTESFRPQGRIENLRLLSAAGRNVFAENDSTVWACNGYGCFSAGVLYRVHIKQHTVQAFPFDRVFERFCRASDGKIWLATQGGATCFARFDPVEAHFSNLKFDNEPPSLNTSPPAFLLESRQKDRLWYSNESGLYLLDTKRMTILKGFFGTAAKKDADLAFPAFSTLSNPHVMVIQEAPDGKLWLGTNGGGVNILNPETGAVQVLGLDEGLPDNRVCGILPDGQDWWFSTWRGLACYDAASGIFRNYFDTDGLAHNEFNRLSFCKDPGGRLWFGGLNGVSAFLPEALKQKKKATRLLLAEAGFFDKDGKTLLRQRSGFGEIPHFTLPPNNRSAWFKVALADFAHPEGNTFSYRIEPPGGGGDWKRNGANRLLHFDYLPAGEYVLRVRGESSSGSLVGNELQIRLTIQEFFYKTPWFIALCVLALGLLGYVFHRLRLAQMLRLERMRTRISSDLHDEVGGLLSGVALQMELLEYTAADEKQKVFIQRIAATSRNAMSKMRDVIWAIDARKDTLEDLLERMKEYAQEQLSPLDIEYHFEVKNLPLKGSIASELRHNLYLIFKEFLTNTSKHAQAKQVHIRLARTDGVFEMRLQDNGKGLVQPVKTTGQGLANMKMRAARIGATLEFLDEGGFGILLRRKAF